MGLASGTAAQHGTAVQYSKLQHSTVQYSTLQGIALHVTQRVEWFARRR
jgi:hypothetical protein